MRSIHEFRLAAELSAQGLSDAAVAKVLSIPRSTVRDWRRQRFDCSARRGDCPTCAQAPLDERNYAYLLGLYLGDGHISRYPRGVFRLRIFVDSRHPEILQEARRAIAALRPTRDLSPGVVAARGCVYVSSYWKHWPCLFPQHGAGPKHARKIRLEPWQDRAVRAWPTAFVRGLIHSDGCRVENRVGGRSYVRYMFCNHSGDIVGLFVRACADAGISCTRPSWRTVSIARAADTARLDSLVGPKR